MEADRSRCADHAVFIRIGDGSGGNFRGIERVYPQTSGVQHCATGEVNAGIDIHFAHRGSHRNGSTTRSVGFSLDFHEGIVGGRGIQFACRLQVGAACHIHAGLGFGHAGDDTQVDRAATAAGRGGFKALVGVGINVDITCRCIDISCRTNIDGCRGVRLHIGDGTPHRAARHTQQLLEQILGDRMNAAGIARLPHRVGRCAGDDRDIAATDPAIDVHFRAGRGNPHVHVVAIHCGKQYRATFAGNHRTTANRKLVLRDQHDRAVLLDQRGLPEIACIHGDFAGQLVAGAAS